MVRQDSETRVIPWANCDVIVSLRNYGEDILQYIYEEDGKNISEYLRPGLSTEKNFRLNVVYTIRIKRGRACKVVE